MFTAKFIDTVLLNKIPHVLGVEMTSPINLRTHASANANGQDTWHKHMRKLTICRIGLVGLVVESGSER